MPHSSSSSSGSSSYNVKIVAGSKAVCPSGWCQILASIATNADVVAAAAIAVAEHACVLATI